LFSLSHTIASIVIHHLQGFEQLTHPLHQGLTKLRCGKRRIHHQGHVLGGCREDRQRMCVMGFQPDRVEDGVSGELELLDRECTSVNEHERCGNARI